MPIITEDDLAAEELSAEIEVADNKVTSVVADGPFTVFVQNGTEGFVEEFRNIDPPHTASFIAASDTIKVEASQEAIHFSVYQNA